MLVVKGYYQSKWKSWSANNVVLYFIHFYSASRSMAVQKRSRPQQLTLCRSLHTKALQATVSEGLAQGPYVAARVGLEPTTLWSPMRLQCPSTCEFRIVTNVYDTAIQILLSHLLEQYMLDFSYLNLYSFDRSLYYCRLQILLRNSDANTNCQVGKKEMLQSQTKKLMSKLREICHHTNRPGCWKLCQRHLWQLKTI